MVCYMTGQGGLDDDLVWGWVGGQQLSCSATPWADTGVKLGLDS